MQHINTEFRTTMNNVNSFLNQQQHDLEINAHFDTTSSPDDFLEQMLSSIPNNNSSFGWADEQHQINKALLLQQQLLLSRDLLADHNDVVESANDASIKPIFNGFTGSMGQNSNQIQHFQGGSPPATNQAAASGSSGGGAAGQPRQRVRARRGQATDPHSIAERLRRERIAERMKALQELVPNGNKTDKASMLDEIIDYVKFLQLQVKVLSVSRLGGAAAAAPRVGDMSPQGRNGNGTQTASSSNNDGMTVAENQVVKMMEEDMGSAMQYLQGKGLCLMPISLATAISSATSHTRNPLNTNGNPRLNGENGGPTSPSLSALTVQSANGVREKP